MTENKAEVDYAFLVKNHLPALLLYARQWPHDSAEDVVQEAFLSLFHQEKIPENIISWLFAVVRNFSNKNLQKQQRRRQREEQFSIQKESWFVQEIQNFEKNEEIQKLVTELKLLPFKFREIIIAKIWGKLTFEEIAEIYGLSSSSVHRRYQTGLKLLHEKLKIF